jgi:monoamine oxidase
MANNETEVAIIGGGAAGIAAGRRLRAKGVDCLLLEARARLGGRAWTVNEGSHALDLGCGWLHSADRNPWVTVAQEQGRTIDKTPPAWTRPSLPIRFPLSEQVEYRRAMSEFYGRLQAMLAKHKDVAATEGLEPGNRWNNMITAVCTFISGAELGKISARDFIDYADSEINWTIIDGYGATIAAAGKDVPTIFDCPVQRIDHSGKRLMIETAKGPILADRAIIALPSSIIAENEAWFAPALPDKTAAARGLPLGLADKLFIALAEPEEFEPNSRVFGYTDRVATASYQLRPFGRPMIECYFGGENAAALEAGGTQGFFDFAVSELTDIFGSAFARRLRPIRMHCWGADPFAHGSYSYAQPGMAACRGQLATPVDGRLFFAGEACSSGDFSTAHGAWATGVAAADAVLAARQWNDGTRLRV